MLRQEIQDPNSQRGVPPEAKGPKHSQWLKVNILRRHNTPFWKDLFMWWPKGTQNRALQRMSHSLKEPPDAREIEIESFLCLGLSSWVSLSQVFSYHQRIAKDHWFQGTRTLLLNSPQKRPGLIPECFELCTRVTRALTCTKELSHKEISSEFSRGPESRSPKVCPSRKAS